MNNFCLSVANNYLQQQVKNEQDFLLEILSNHVKINTDLPMKKDSGSKKQKKFIMQICPNCNEVIAFYPPPDIKKRCVDITCDWCYHEFNWGALWQE
ncbi:MAG: hypothetical protein IPP74_14190 [Alphaproteobacteria bacterium]|nr:hypothetical protein [Alphaproteobacteria bacterium]